MDAYEKTQEQLRAKPLTWLVTGCAGFIGSNLTEKLLLLGQNVVGLDNFSTGYRHNIDEVREEVGPEASKRFRFIEGDIRDAEICREACAGVDVVLHQAALGSVPRSVKDPYTSHTVNTDGFMQVLLAARDAGVKRIVYASSSAVYGDHPGLPKVEDQVGRPLSPYAITKKINELYAQNFAELYGMEIIGLRYFNVFGKRQDANGAYAAVIPKWVGALIHGGEVFINGDGETSRDFCYIGNVVQANMIAATVSTASGAANRVYNVAVGARTTLNELFGVLQSRIARVVDEASGMKPTLRDFRLGDVRHSLADISLARSVLGYSPEFSVTNGLDDCLGWYLEKRARWASSPAQQAQPTKRAG